MHHHGNVSFLACFVKNKGNGFPVLDLLLYSTIDLIFVSTPFLFADSRIPTEQFGVRWIWVARIVIGTSIVK